MADTKYLVRGIGTWFPWDPNILANCEGRANESDNYFEYTVDSGVYETPNSGPFDIVEQLYSASGVELMLRINLNTTSLETAQSARVMAHETVLTWAEKCRSRGTRGFRLSAVKKPRLERNKKTGVYQVYYSVLLSSVIFHNGWTWKEVNYDDFQLEQEQKSLGFWVFKNSGASVEILRRV